MVVRTWRPERDRRLVCVLDTGRTSAARIGDEPRLDAAIDAALLLASVAARADDRVDLLAVDTAVRAVGDQRRQEHRCCGGWSPRWRRCEPALVETDFGLVAGEVLRRERKRALVVLFTALEPGALGEGLLPVLPQLAARHKVIVAAVHDPALASMAQVRPRRGAGRGLRGRRRAARPRRAGPGRAPRCAATASRWSTRPADVFASRVTDHYLALKADRPALTSATSAARARYRTGSGRAWPAVASAGHALAVGAPVRVGELGRQVGRHASRRCARRPRINT